MNSWATLAIAALIGLTGCGGGGSDSGCSVYSSGCSGGASTSTGSSDSGTVATSTSGTVVLSLSNNTISASSPGTVTALVKKNDGTALANVMVTFAVTNGSATVSPARVMTDATGSASTTLQPVAGTLGADYVTADVDLSSTTKLSTKATFTVSSVTVTMTGVSAAPTSVDAYGASVVTASISGASSASPVTVNFSSTCATAGKATLSPTSVTVTGSTASTTYQDKACGAADRVTAVIAGTSQQGSVDLTVKAPSVQSLEFVSASPDKICLAGSGCSVSSVVSFRVKDQFGNPLKGQTVNFALDIPNVATLSTTSAPTDATGIAQVSVSAKTLPTPVRVRGSMTLSDGSAFTTVSNSLSINAGLPTQRAFSFAASAYNVDGLEKDGTESAIRLQLTDRFGNPVPDGTAISLVSEGASVIPARCLTTDGICSVKFVSSNFRPANGRVTVVAYAQGEESFSDEDGDNLYTSGEAFGDLGPVYLDKNESGVMDSSLGEYIVGSVANGKWDDNTYVRMSRLFTLSSSATAPRFYQWNSATGTCTSTHLGQLSFNPTPAACRQSVRFCMRDGNSTADDLGGNPVPAGAVLTVATKAKSATALVDGTPVSSVATSPTSHLVMVELSDCSTPLESGGPIDLTVKMPAGQTYTVQIGTVN
jgi:hypothetical protein